MLTSGVSGQHRIFLESDKLGWNGRDFLFGCSEREKVMKKAKAAKKSRRPTSMPKIQKERLKGWIEIASFLGQPVAVAQRWARSGMPVMREGRFMYASREELSQYLGREAGLDVPVHIATENADLSADLKRALAHARAGNQVKKRNTKR
jgi:hypothetical protein